MVDVAAAHIGDVVGEELQRDHREQRHQEFVSHRQLDDEIALVEVVVALLHAKGQMDSMHTCMRVCR